MKIFLKILGLFCLSTYIIALDQVPNGELHKNGMVRINHIMDDESIHAGTGFIIKDNMVVTAHQISTNSWTKEVTGKRIEKSFVVLKDGSKKVFSLEDVIRYKDTDITVIKFSKGTFSEYPFNLDLIRTLDLNDENKRFFNPTFFPQEAMDHKWSLTSNNYSFHTLKGLLSAKIFEKRIEEPMSKYTNKYFAPYGKSKTTEMLLDEEIKLLTLFPNKDGDAGSPLINDQGFIVGLHSNFHYFSYSPRFLSGELPQYINTNSYEVFDDDFMVFLHDLNKEIFVKEISLKISRPGKDLIIGFDNRYKGMLSIILKVIKQYAPNYRMDNWLGETSGLDLDTGISKSKHTFPNFFSSYNGDFSKLEMDLEEQCYLEYQSSLK